MNDSAELLPLYLHLARACELRRQAMERDKVLVLAGATAAELGLNPVAAACRRKILAANTGHLVRRFDSFTHARGDEEFETYLKQLRRSFPREKVEHMLDALGVERGNERATYASDYEYAAALLGSTPDALEAQLREEKPLPGETWPEAGELHRTNWWLTGVLLALLLAVVAVVIWLSV
jgi:hypothetical protein